MATADIRKFTGFIAADGSTHESMTKARAHADDLKIKAALTASFKTLDHGQAAVYQPDGTAGLAVHENDMPEWLFANRVAIMAALSVRATTRAPRKPRSTKAANDSAAVKTA